MKHSILLCDSMYPSNIFAASLRYGGHYESEPYSLAQCLTLLLPKPPLMLHVTFLPSNHLIAEHPSTTKLGVDLRVECKSSQCRCPKQWS